MAKLITGRTRQQEQLIQLRMGRLLERTYTRLLQREFLRLAPIAADQWLIQGLELALAQHSIRLRNIIDGLVARALQVYSQPILDIARTKSERSIFEQLTENFLKTHGLERAVALTNRTRNDILATIVKGRSDGLNSARIANNIASKIRDLSIPRARRIARTEIHTAAQVAADSAIDSVGVAGQVMKEWITARDERARSSHVFANGQQRGKEEFFDVGGAKLKYPGDPRAPAREIVNCRCISGYIVITGEQPEQRRLAAADSIEGRDEARRAAKRERQRRRRASRREAAGLPPTKPRRQTVAPTPVAPTPGNIPVDPDEARRQARRERQRIRRQVRRDAAVTKPTPAVIVTPPVTRTPAIPIDDIGILGVKEVRLTSIGRRSGEKLVRLGKKTGKEALSLVDGNRELSFDASGGTDHSVRLGQRTVFLSKTRTGLTAHHNHPNSSSLSVDDFQVTSSLDGLDKIVAHGHDGSIYEASVNVRRGTITRMYNDVDKSITASYYQEARETGVTLKSMDRGFVSSHLINVALHRMGAITYRATLDLASRKAIELHSEAFEKFIARAIEAAS